MEAYPNVAANDKPAVAVSVPSSAWSLERRLALTWWRNGNARGIAEPDPRTVRRGARAKRALSAPCPYSRLRSKREHKLDGYRHAVPRVVKRLLELASCWLDPAELRAHARELEAAYARGAWFIEDVEYERRQYERRGPVYLPRRSYAAASAFVVALRRARAKVRFVEAQLRRERDARMAQLLPGLRPSASRVDQRSTRTPDGRNFIDLAANGAAWNEKAPRVGRTIAVRDMLTPPPTTT